MCYTSSQNTLGTDLNAVQESAARRRANERTHCPKFSIIVFIVLLVKFSDYPNQVLSTKFKMYKKMVKYKER